MKLKAEKRLITRGGTVWNFQRLRQRTPTKLCEVKIRANDLPVVACERAIRWRLGTEAEMSGMKLNSSGYSGNTDPNNHPKK